MPLVKFTGPDGPEQHEYRGLMLAEARHVQRVADLTVAALESGVFSTDPDPTAITAMVQVLWKRRGNVVKFDEVDFDLRTWDLELLPEEEDEALSSGDLVRCESCGQSMSPPKGDDDPEESDADPN